MIVPAAKLSGLDPKQHTSLFLGKSLTDGGIDNSNHGSFNLLCEMTGKRSFKS